MNRSHIKIALFTVLTALGLMIPISQAEARGTCRDYTKTSLLNGRVELSIAQACRDYGDRWEIVDVQGPVEMRDYMLGMIHRDLYALNPRYVIVNNPRYYYAPAPERVVVYRKPPPPVYYYPKNHKHAQYKKHKHDHHNWKHDRHDDDRWDRGRHHHNHDRHDNDRRGGSQRSHGIGSWR